MFESEVDCALVQNSRPDPLPRWTVGPIIAAIRRIGAERPDSIAARLKPLTLISVARSLRKRYSHYTVIYNDGDILSALWAHSRRYPHQFEK